MEHLLTLFRQKEWKVKSRMLWLLIAAVWLFVILKMILSAVFGKDTTLVSAFSATNPVFTDATVEISVRYPVEYFDSFDKKQILLSVAEKIGLQMLTEPLITVTESRQEVSYIKEAKKATTQLRAVSISEETTDGIRMNHYLYVKLSLKESVQAVLFYKEVLEEALEGLGCTDISTIVSLTGEYEGYLTLERRDEVTDKILKALDARVMYEHRKEELYTVYGYTDAFKEYVTVEGNKINLHIAVSQNEERYRTIIYVASPILPDTW